MGPDFHHTFVFHFACWGDVEGSNWILSSTTLPETNSLHLKMDGWNTSFLLGWPIFRTFAVSFRECIWADKTFPLPRFPLELGIQRRSPFLANGTSNNGVVVLSDDHIRKRWLNWNYEWRSNQVYFTGKMGDARFLQVILLLQKHQHWTQIALYEKG